MTHLGSWAIPTSAHGIPVMLVQKCETAVEAKEEGKGWKWCIRALVSKHTAVIGYNIGY